MMNRVHVSVAIASAVLVAACTVSQQQTPGLSGPSTFAQSLTITASPDHLVQDGVSASSITVQAVDANGRGQAGVALRFDTIGGENLLAAGVQSFGTLSTRNVTTDGSGRASVTYTAPPPAPPPANSTVNSVLVQATITNGTDARSSAPATVGLSLMPIGQTLPPSDTPVPNFVFVPATPTVGAPVTFDGSSSTGVSPIVSYAWSFGDGSPTVTSQTPVANHVFSAIGSYSVQLTVTNARGAMATKSLLVPVGAAALPVAVFVSSPGTPGPGQVVQFTDTSTPVPGRSNVAWDWNFGDPGSGAANAASGKSVTHTFSGGSGSSFTVVLTVTDDLGQKGTATAVVQIK